MPRPACGASGSTKNWDANRVAPLGAAVECPPLGVDSLRNANGPGTTRMAGPEVIDVAASPKMAGGLQLPLDLPGSGQPPSGSGYRRAGPDHAGPDHAGPDRAGPDRAGSGRSAGPDRAGRDAPDPQRLLEGLNDSQR